MTLCSVIDGFQFSVGINLLSYEGKVGDSLLRIPQALPGADGSGSNGIAPFHQFLIAADAVFGEKFMVAAARFRFSMVAHRWYPALCWALILF